jgi:hypothetical protein
MDVPRLSTYPYVIVRIACEGCRRKGAYRLARLADRFGAEAGLDDVLKRLSADCPNRGLKRFKGAYPVCGAMLPDLGSPTPPDVPPAVALPSAATPLPARRRPPSPARPSPDGAGPPARDP